MLENGEDTLLDQAQRRATGGEVLRSFGRLLLFVLLTGALLTGLMALVRPQYGAEARLMIEQLSGSGDAASRMPEPMLVASQIEVMRSFELAARVASRNRLERDPEFNEALAPLGPLKRFAILADLLPDPAKLPEQERVIRNIAAKLSVSFATDTMLVSLGFRSDDADKSARLANDIAATYVEWLEGAVPLTRESPFSGAAAETAALKARIAEQETRLAEMMAAQSKAAAATADTAAKPEDLDNLHSQIILARVKRQEFDIRAERLREALARGGDLQRSGELFGTGPIERLFDRQDALLRRYEKATAAMLPSHPQMKRLAAERESLRSELRSEAEAVVAGLVAEAVLAAERERMLQKEQERRESHTAAPHSTNSGAEEIETLRRALADDRRRLADSEARLDAARIVRSDGPPRLKASLISPATPDRAPVFPKKGPVVLGGMAAVLALGLVQLWLQLTFGWPNVDRRKGGRRAGERPASRDGEEMRRPTRLAPRETEPLAAAGR